MRILIIKTSSMGDVIHTLPAVSDVATVFPGAVIDWVVEESFTNIPAWHGAINEIIPVALRRWRKNPWLAWRSGELRQCKQKIRSHHYDYVIDAQGLMKSAFLTRYARGVRCGPDRRSAREGIASFAYHKKVPVDKKSHAVVRVRQLFSQILGYALPTVDPVYGINRLLLPENPYAGERYLVFLHGTTWDTKHYPEQYWQQLCAFAQASGYRVKLLWGNAHEKDRAQRLAKGHDAIDVCPRLNLNQIAALLADSQGVIAVDTGLGHLACALEVPTVSLYGPTDPDLTGTFGVKQKHLGAKFTCAPCLRRTCNYPGQSVVQPPCFTSYSPEKVWQVAMEHLSLSKDVIHD